MQHTVFRHPCQCATEITKCKSGKPKQTLDHCLMLCPQSTYCTPKELFTMSDNAGFGCGFGATSYDDDDDDDDDISMSEYTH